METGSNEIEQLPDGWERMAHSGIALMYSSVIERMLGALIEEALPGMTKSIRKGLFTAANAPLSSFSARIHMAGALKIVTPEESVKLHAIRAVRNAFAHCEIGVHFDHPAIAAKVSLLKPEPDQNHFSAYTDNAMSLIDTLTKKKRHYAVAHALMNPPKT